MKKQTEILKRINILLYQIADSIESGEVEMGWAKKSTDEIDKLIDDLDNEIN